jgi:DHA1 family multidrug resistance protein-like MFS transporter
MTSVDGAPVRREDAGTEPELRLWRRNLIALTAAVFIGFAGFTLVMPFLPIYIQQMGVQDVGTIAAWTGLSLGVTPAMTALLTPLWGRFADRFGRKFMVGRSLVSFVILMAAMGYATEPWHIFALRVAQGFFAGYGALCLSMAAESAPAGRMAQSIGLVQTAQRLGPALGPVIGGAVAGAVGLRATFLVTAGFYLIAFILLLVVYVERPVARGVRSADESRTERVTFTNVLAFENFLLLMGLIFGFQFVDRSLGPVLPLHLTALGVSDTRVAITSGLIFSVLACTAALGHHWCAGLLGRWGGRRTLARASLLAAASAVLMAIAADTVQFTAAVAAFGIGIGVAMTAAYTTAAGAIPDTVRATGFGFLTSASLIGMAVSPMVAGLIAHAGIRLVFLVDAVMLVAFGAAVQRVMEERPRETTGPAMEDA